MIEYEIYIDESCHLERDGSSAMGIGYVKVESELRSEYKEQIKAIKLKHKTPVELKWTGISSSRLPMYKELVDLFFSSKMCFRCIIINYKQNLDHEKHNDGDHLTFYQKLVYYLLNSPLNNPEHRYRVFLDVVNTRNSSRRETTERVLQNAFKGNSPFVSLQDINSASPFTQYADLFIGAITYKSRGEHSKKGASKAKLELIEYIEGKCGYILDTGTPPWEHKFNIFKHQPRKGEK